MAKRRNEKLKLVNAVRPEIRDISDKSKLVWNGFFGPMQAAAAQLNLAISAAQNTVAACIIQAEGLSVDEWTFDMDTLKLVSRPKAG